MLLFTAAYLALIIWCIFFAGACEGIMDAISFRPWDFYGKEYWDPRYSWKRKWKNGDEKQGECFWGSSRWFVFLTDGWHLMKFCRNTFATLAATFLLAIFIGFWLSFALTVSARLVYWLGFHILFEKEYYKKIWN